MESENVHINLPLVATAPRVWQALPGTAGTARLHLPTYDVVHSSINTDASEDWRRHYKSKYRSTESYDIVDNMTNVCSDKATLAHLQILSGRDYSRNASTI
jgi:hypothetical protein